MIRVLTNLGDLIGAYGIPHQNQEEDEQIEQALLAALTKIGVDSHIQYLNHGSRELSQQSFRIFYSQLRRTFNTIYSKKNRQVDLIILKFHELFQTYEDIYSQDMNLEEPLADYPYHLLKIELQQKFPALKEALSQKKIWVQLLSEIQSAIDTNFKSPFSKICYYHYLFFSKLLESLSHIAEDDRDKDWERRFIETMININFNHKGFFNRLTEIIDYQLSTLSLKDQMMSMLINGLRISQAARDPLINYDHTCAHLADLLNEYTDKKKELNAIQEAKIETEEINQPEEDAKPNGIPTQLYANQINLFTHYMYLAGVFPEDMTKRDVCSNIADHVLNKRGQFVSKDGLEKFDRQKLESGVIQVHGAFKKMCQDIERDFDYLL